MVTLTSIRDKKKLQTGYKTVTSDPLNLSMIASLLVHMGIALLIAGRAEPTSILRRQDPITISVIPTSVEEKTPRHEEKTRQETKKPKPRNEVAKIPSTLRIRNIESVPPERFPPPLVPAEEPPARLGETKPASPITPENPHSFVPGARGEGGGNTYDAANLSGNGSVGVLAGPGRTGEGGAGGAGMSRASTTGSLLGRSSSSGSGRREAKPNQTVRANYPPMALRAGLESDVTLGIKVDAQGNVTRAEITKSGGAGFDEEALKAVKQSRFEPAQRDGQNVAAESIYIYRFRLKR